MDASHHGREVSPSGTRRCGRSRAPSSAGRITRVGITVCSAVALTAAALAGCSSTTTGGAAPSTAAKPAGGSTPAGPGTTGSGVPTDSTKTTKPSKHPTGGDPLDPNVFLGNYLVRNAPVPGISGALPLNYRSFVAAAEAPPEGVNTIGLGDLDVSGSAQFSAPQLDAIIGEAGGKVLDLDLRGESHGFTGDDAISWYAPRDWSMTGLTNDQMLAAEKDRLDSLKPGSTVDVIDGTDKVNGSFVAGITTSVEVKDPRTEESLASSRGIAYARIQATDHTPLTPAEMDQVIAVYRQWRQSPGTRLHVHCAGGDGRTTTVLVALDMLANADRVSLEDIVTRQAKIGEGTNVLKTGDPTDTFYYQYKARGDLIRSFYDYAKANPGGQGQTFAEWVAAHPVS